MGDSCIDLPKAKTMLLYRENFDVAKKRNVRVQPKTIVAGIHIIAYIRLEDLVVLCVHK